MSSNDVQFKKLTHWVNNRRQKKNDKSDNSSSSGNDESAAASVPVVSKKRRVGGVVTSTNPTRMAELAKSAKEAAKHSSDSDSETEERRKLLGIGDVYKSSNTAERAGPSDMGATATLQIETAYENDAQTIYANQRAAREFKRKNPHDKTYMGQNAYGGYVEKQDSVYGNATNGLIRMGPVRAPDYLRQSILWEYHPGLCKDYKETGYCVFGEACKFRHDRTDYKFGWEIEQELAKGPVEQGDQHENLEVHDEEEALPFKCLLCRDSFNKPVVTKCKHYFCEKCILNHYLKKSQKCPVCETNTHGVFNPAKEIIARMTGEKLTKTGRRKRDQKDDAEMSSGESSINDEPVDRNDEEVDINDDNESTHDDAEPSEQTEQLIEQERVEQAADEVEEDDSD